MISLLLLCALGLTQDPIVLKAGRPFAGELHTLTHPRQDFEVVIPENSVYLKLRVVTRDGDVDLFGGPGDAPDDLFDAPLSAAAELGFEDLVVDRLTDPPIAPGSWWFSVETGDIDLFGNGDPKSPRIAFTLQLDIISTRTDAVLAPGPAQHFSLDPASGGFRCFRIDVPEGTAALRVDLHRVPANLDLFARRGAPMVSLETAQARACHEWGAESLLITQNTRPSLAAGTWYVDVIDAMSANMSTPFDIRVAFSEAAPAEWSTPPVLVPREPVKPLSRALCSVLEVFSSVGGGSATLVTPDGLALTNAHVVDRGDRQPVDELVLAANLDSRRPAEESFRGSVVRFDAELDLALIQIDRGFYGAPLAAEYRFPTVELGADTLLDIGDPLWIVGYPSLGGTGSRVSIHCAHGVLSGFDQEEAGVLFKTDAAVIPGNSGGAALDDRGRLVGVPSANLSDGSGLVGLVVPVSMLPAEWTALIKSRQKPTTR